MNPQMGSVVSDVVVGDAVVVDDVTPVEIIDAGSQIEYQDRVHGASSQYRVALFFTKTH